MIFAPVSVIIKDMGAIPGGPPADLTVCRNLSGQRKEENPMIETGATFELKTKVTEQNTAVAVGSGDVPVFATPMMMALMEGAAAQCLAQFLEEGKTSVGGNISSSHVSATPVGMEVRAVATITEVDGKKVKFAIEAYDEAGLIGKGEHLRIIVTRDRFVQGAYDKLNK